MLAYFDDKTVYYNNQKMFFQSEYPDSSRLIYTFSKSASSHILKIDFTSKKYLEHNQSLVEKNVWDASQGKPLKDFLCPIQDFGTFQSGEYHYYWVLQPMLVDDGVMVIDHPDFQIFKSRLREFGIIDYNPYKNKNCMVSNGKIKMYDYGMVDLKSPIKELL